MLIILFESFHHYPRNLSLTQHKHMSLNLITFMSLNLITFKGIIFGKEVSISKYYSSHLVTPGSIHDVPITL